MDGWIWFLSLIREHCCPGCCFWEHFMWVPVPLTDVYLLLIPPPPPAPNLMPGTCIVSQKPMILSNWVFKNFYQFLIDSSNIKLQLKFSWLPVNFGVLKAFPLCMCVCVCVCVCAPSQVWHFVTPWTAACQVSLFSTISWSLLKCLEDPKERS